MLLQFMACTNMMGHLQPSSHRFQQYRSFGRVTTQQQTCNQASAGFTNNNQTQLNQHFDQLSLCGT